MVTGAALGVAGVLLQSVIRNPLGEPHILGLNAGAALAVVITSALGLSLPFGRPLVAAAGAAALFLLVLMFSSSGRTGLTPMKVTLCGVAMSAFASSITAAVLILDEQTLLAMRTWLAGMAGINVQTLRSALWAAAAGFVLAIGLSPSLNMLALGDRMAQGLGVSLLKTRLLALLAIAALRRGRLNCRADWLYRPGRAAAHSPSGVGRFTRDGAAVCPVWRAGSAAGGYRRPHAVYALGAGNRHHDGPGRRARIHLYGVEDVQMNRAGFRAIRIGRVGAGSPAGAGVPDAFSAGGVKPAGLWPDARFSACSHSAIGRALFSPESLTAETRYIVMDIRLPRLLMAVLCGAMLGMAGAAMQSITRNGLADPGLIGVKEGCSAAVLLLIFQFPALGLAWRPLVGMAGGLLTALLVIGLARDISRPRFILIGIGVSWAFAAAMGVFMTTADVRDVQTAMLWLAGSLHAANWTLVG
jgi:ABC-type Fe3+-siderophore transport system permease subunit